MRREAYIGAGEVDQLIGKWQSVVGQAPWQSIIGSAPWQDITGTEVQYTNPYWHRPAPLPAPLAALPLHHHVPWWRRHHHHAAPYVPPYAAPYTPPYGVPNVRDHRAYVMGEPAGAPALPPGPMPPMAPMPALPAPIHAAVPPPMAPPIPAPVTAAAPAVATPEVPPEHPSHPDHHLPQNHPHHPAHPHHPHHRRYRATGWAPAVEFWASPEGGPWPYQIPPRNLLVDRPGPTGADRVILPMSSGVNILPNTSAQITSRPQNYAFRPERVIISNASDWVINDIKVGNMSQFSQSGDVPGEMFGATTIDGFVKFTTCQTAMDFVIVTTFVGASEAGSSFVCGVLGTAAVN